MKAPYQPLEIVMLTVLLVGSALVAGCSGGLQTIEPGAPITEYRVVESYDKVDVSRALNLTVLVGDANDTVKLVVSEGFMPYVRTTVEGGKLTLTIDTEVDISTLQSNFITIQVPSLSMINASGASRVIIADTLQADELDLTFSGASAATMALNVRQLDLNASGASVLDLIGWADTFNAKPVSGASIITGFGLVTRLCTVDASGASILEVNVSEKLDVRASGASVVSYRGRPVITSELTGGSMVVDKN